MSRVAKTRIPYLTEIALSKGVRFLAGVDPDLRRIVEEFGPPPIWARETGFPTLIHIILEQQVSLASARAAFNRLRDVASPLTPHRFLELNDDTLRTAGFSRQKTGYGRQLARSVIDGNLDFSNHHLLQDAEIRAQLTSIKGIGNWTADIYLLMALRRPDIWPRGDLALAVAVQNVKRLSARPAQPELDAMSLQWQPWRAVAARLFWHHYLSKPRAR
ncbi:MAG: DNA-3-methyladenine glycosylase 2 family protein [Acidobacteriota bacterium]